MIDPTRAFGCIAALAVLAGCASSDAPRTSRAATPSGPISVVEVEHSNTCGTDGEAPQITLFQNIDELQAWESTHRADLSDAPLRRGAYALVELGARNSGGFGIAISRRAKLRDGVIRLTATFLSPPAGQVTTQAATSPCVLVALPKVEIVKLILLDPQGKEHARSHAPVAVPLPVSPEAPKIDPEVPLAPPASSENAAPVAPASPQ